MSGEQLLNNYEQPDLFILDKQLSGIDGLDICRLLKVQERTKDIPVILMSVNLNIVQLAKEAGADDVLVKPYKLTDRRSIMSRHK